MFTYDYKYDHSLTFSVSLQENSTFWYFSPKKGKPLNKYDSISSYSKILFIFLFFLLSLNRIWNWHFGSLQFLFY